MTFRSSSHTDHEHWLRRHRFEHWYRDNSVYFITSKIREGKALFVTPGARGIFWDRLNHYTRQYRFVPWIVTLMNNHYHLLGYIRDASKLGEMMRKLHGSIATLVMKQTGAHWVPFWRERGKRTYFDGCLRDVLQGIRTYRYGMMQSVRAGIVMDHLEYSDTRVFIKMDRAIQRAVELNAFMEGVPYARYDKWKGRHQC